MGPRLARRARAYGDLCASTDGAGAQRGGTARERGLRSSRPTGGSEFAPRCRGPPHCAAFGDEKDRVAARSFRRLPAPHKNGMSESSRVADGNVTGT